MEEAEYLQKVRNWRRAIDERGLKEEKRQQYITEFLDYIITDLMPWYSDGCKDFSLMEIGKFNLISYLVVPIVFKL